MNPPASTKRGAHLPPEDDSVPPKKQKEFHSTTELSSLSGMADCFKRFLSHGRGPLERPIQCWLNPSTVVEIHNNTGPDYRFSYGALNITPSDGFIIRAVFDQNQVYRSGPVQAEQVLREFSKLSNKLNNMMQVRPQHAWR